VSNKFQDLNYLKAIPKRVDCWLSSKPKKSSKTPRTNKNAQKSPAKIKEQDFSKTAKIYNKLPSKRYNEDNTSGKPDGMKKSPEGNHYKMNASNPNLRGKAVGIRKNTTQNPNTGNIAINTLRYDKHDMSQDTYGVFMNE
jgi:hypothetical protein